MATVISPDDSKSVVTKFPATFRPYGGKTKVPTDVQAVLWHYDVRQSEVDLLDEEGYFRMKDFRAANPGGDARQQKLFAASFDGKIGQALYRAKFIDAFLRLSRDDPFAAITVPIPVIKTSSGKSAPKSTPKQTRFSSDAAVSGATSSLPSAVDGSGASSSSGKKRKPKSDSVIDYSSSDESDVVDDAVDEASEGEVSGESGDAAASTSKKISLHTLFSVVKSEVCFLLNGYEILAIVFVDPSDLFVIRRFGASDASCNRSACCV